MFQVRKNEPDYAHLNNPESQSSNRYGKSIELTQVGSQLHGKSLNINGDSGVGENPNRYKQHGFHFTADNCIACHACEAACSEKNDNPPHLAFRSVGFVEGGTYPSYQRINISMACNHCDNPVCLKGCPTRAYTKFAEYGAVLQDPNICFGCGYCTWVCPYNAPQLDPVKGQVSKCNMCMDRLEAGLKPACAAACLGKALDFGVIENIPEGRTQVKTEIPGFPRTDITHPNIRFQQTRTTQRDMHRVDSTPLQYHRDDQKSLFQPTLDPKHGFKRQWNLRKLLGSHENAHIAFTLSTQMVMGAFLMLILGSWLQFQPIVMLQNSFTIVPILLLMVGVMGFGLFKLNMHLGKPHRFYRGFYNLKLSPVSREIAGVSLFFVGLLGFTFCTVMETFQISPTFNDSIHHIHQMMQPVAQHGFAILGILGAGIGGYFMYKLYRIPARPYWNHWYTGATFLSTALSLGALLLTLIALAWSQFSSELAHLLAIVALLGVTLELVGLFFHARDLSDSKSEGAASFYEQSTTYGYVYWLRNSLLAVLLLTLVLMISLNHFSAVVWIVVTVLFGISSILGRALFYVSVIPTTMPGAFFWRNKGFVEHAIESGLAEMPQLGMERPRHHPFKLGELFGN